MDLVVLGGMLFTHVLPQELAGLFAFGSTESLGFDLGFASGGDDHFDGFHITPPLTWMVNLIEPSFSLVSVTV